MAILTILVDYDNVEPQHKKSGPIILSKLIASKLSATILEKYKTVYVRLYGGWRSGGTLTRLAQKDIVPDIRKSSPTVLSYLLDGKTKNLTIIVELADQPIGWSHILDETFVRERNLRKFRAKKSIQNCINSASCGFSNILSLNYSTNCNVGGCTNTAADVLVRDEQKMVDTLIVADIAQKVLVDKDKEIVVVSSDVDMWPGVILSLRNGCSVIHVHTRQGFRTQKHLLKTLGTNFSTMYVQSNI